MFPVFDLLHGMMPHGRLYSCFELLSAMSHAENDVLILRLFDVLEALERRLDELERTVKKTSQKFESASVFGWSASASGRAEGQPAGACVDYADLDQNTECGGVVAEYPQVEVFCECGCRHLCDIPLEVTSYVSYGSCLKAYAMGLVGNSGGSIRRTSLRRD